MDTGGLRATIALACSVVAVAQPLRIRAQGLPQPQGPPTEITQVRFNSGQSVVPYFEGWIPNADGSFDMVFGYFNRNWKQELVSPVGPDNKVEPGGPDRDQPTYFLPRRQRFVYRVRVPADFGKKEIVWTLTANGRTERGYGNLLPEQEITERVVMTNGNFNPGLDDPNRPPVITIAPAHTARVGVPLTLTASIADDGRPKPRATSPLTRPSTTTAGRVNFGGQVDRSVGERPRGLRASWLQYGGPGKVTFQEAGPVPVAGGQAATTALFAAPGTYRLIVSANDGALGTRAELAVVVGGN